MTEYTHKRYSQDQLTQIFNQMSGIIDYEIKRRNRYRWWVNPTDPASLRLTAEGLKFVKTVLKFESFEFELPEDLTNHHLLQLERVFGGMYFLLKRKKIIVFDEAEAVMLTLHGSNLRNYLESLDATNG